MLNFNIQKQGGRELTDRVPLWGWVCSSWSHRNENRKLVAQKDGQAGAQNSSWDEQLNEWLNDEWMREQGRWWGSGKGSFSPMYLFIVYLFICLHLWYTWRMVEDVWVSSATFQLLKKRFFKNIYLVCNHMCVFCLQVSLCTMYAPGAIGDERRALILFCSPHHFQRGWPTNSQGPSVSAPSP